METEDELTPEDVERRQLQLVAAEDQWSATWGKGPAPKHSPDLRPLIHRFDAILQSAAQILELGVVVSPMSVQLLKNALAMYTLGQGLDTRELSETEYDEYAEWLYTSEATKGAQDGRRPS